MTDAHRIHELEQRLSALRTAVRSAAHELSVWSADVLADEQVIGSHEDLAQRLSAVAERLLAALRPSGSPVARGSDD
jgi:hypothetical protein